MLIHLIYISKATTPMSEAGLVALLGQSRARNLRQDVTGMLLYADGSFLQVLEGQAADVDAIYGSIQRDARNTDVFLVARDAILERSFPGWSMGFANASGLSPERLPGFSRFLDLQADELPNGDADGVAMSLLTLFRANHP